MTARKKPGFAFWTTLLTVVGAVYCLSYGPACWAINAMANRGWLRPHTDWIRQLVFLVFLPIRHLHTRGPRAISHALDWYAHLLH